MPNSDGSSEKMKIWSRKISQEEWDAIFNNDGKGPHEEEQCNVPNCPYCGGPE